MSATGTAGLTIADRLPLPRLALHALLVFAGYYAGAKVGLMLTFSPNPISVLWPPNAVLLAALLLTGERAWPVLLLAALPAHLLAEIEGGVPAPMVLCWYVSNVSEALIGAASVRYLLGRRVLVFGGVREVGCFMAGAVVLAPFLSSFLDSAFVMLNAWGDKGYWQLWYTRFFSNMLAALTLVPLILTAATLRWSALRAAAPARIAEGLALACSVLAVSIVVFDLHPSAFNVPGAQLYLPLPFLVWAALRFGPVASSVSFAAIAFFAIWGAAHGLGPFTTSAPEENARGVQFFLIFVGVTVLAYAAFLQERRRTEAERLREQDALRESEARFRLLADTAPTMIWMTDVDRLCTFVNKGWLDFTGRSLQDELGNGWYDGVHPDDRDRCTATYRAAVDAQRRYQLEVRLRDREGRYRWLIASGAPRFAADGTFTGYIGSCTDVSEHKASERTLRLAMDVLPIAILMVDEAGRIGFANAHAEKLFGYSQDELTGASVDMLIAEPAGYSAQRDGIFALPLAQAMGAGRGHRALRRDGSDFIAEVGLHPIGGADGLRVLVAIVDATEHYELERSRRELAHMTRISLMGELAASIAHELNQPLTAILANARAAQQFMRADKPDVAEVCDILADIASDDNRAAEVIRRMRSLARKGELEMAPLELSTLIREVAVLVQSDAIVRGVRLSMQLDDDLRVNGDRVQLQQVVLNLLLNAFDAVKDRPPAQRLVTVTAGADAKGARVTVADSGTGVPADKLDSIFDPFFTSKRDGIGLGLSISRSIIEAHAGRLRAVNNADCGATFEFVLPALPGARA
ncbi:MAG TPA: PAS domain S-box protein [Burkholderiales bacterium]|nr:PAS domain S-box protein [Burkholderiales bacterium]